MEKLHLNYKKAMLPKWIKEIAKLASESNPNLSGVYFKKNKIVVTDNFKLLEVTTTDYDTSLVPRTEPINFVDKYLIDFMIPAVAFKNVVIPKEKSAEFKEILNKWYFIDRKTDGERTTQVSMFTNDLKTEDIIQTRTMNSTFPAYESRFEIDEVYHEVSLSVDHMIDLLKAFKAIWHKSFVMQFAESNLQWVELYGDEIEAVEKTRAIIMPLKM